jgi:hypothetical protein
MQLRTFVFWAAGSVLIATGQSQAQQSSVQPSSGEVTAEDKAASVDPILPDWLFRNRKLIFYGQLSPSIVNYDDGQVSDALAVDNSNSASRVGLLFDWDGIFGRSRINFETSLGFRQSGTVDQLTNQPLFELKSGSLRKFEFINFRDIGTISLGQGSMSTDGVAEIDQSGTGIVASSSIADTAAALYLREAGGTLSSVQLGNVFQNLDGFRSLRMRYDTNEKNGLSGSVSLGAQVIFKELDENTVEVAASYKTDVGVYKVSAAGGVAVVLNNSSGDKIRTVGSVSALNTVNGLNIQFAAGGQNSGGAYAYSKFGWRTDKLGAGTTFLSADVYRGWDFGGPGNVSSSIGLGASQEVEKINAEVYAGYHRYWFDDNSGTTYLPASAIQFGARWRF